MWWSHLCQKKQSGQDDEEGALLSKVGTNNKLWSFPPTQTTIGKVRKQVNQGRGPTSIKGWEGEGTCFAKPDNFECCRQDNASED